MRWGDRLRRGEERAQDLRAQVLRTETQDGRNTRNRSMADEDCGKKNVLWRRDSQQTLLEG